DYATFYKAIAQIELGQLDAANNNLQALSQKNVFALIDDVRWNLALVNIKQGKTRVAIFSLRQLTISEKYEERAEQLLKDL
ncbi:MAG: hypothetical protein AAGJ18_12035, partial [Bacteroidota bacterium]